MPKRYTGPELSDLLDQVVAEHGPSADITSVNRIRTGGVAGFFCTEEFEVVVQTGASSMRSDPGQSHGAATPSDQPAIAAAIAGEQAKVASSGPPLTAPVDPRIGQPSEPQPIDREPLQPTMPARPSKVATPPPRRDLAATARPLATAARSADRPADDLGSRATVSAQPPTSATGSVSFDPQVDPPSAPSKPGAPEVFGGPTRSIAQTGDTEARSQNLLAQRLDDPTIELERFESTTGAEPAVARATAGQHMGHRPVDLTTDRKAPEAVEPLPDRPSANQPTMFRPAPGVAPSPPATPFSTSTSTSTSVPAPASSAEAVRRMAETAPVAPALEAVMLLTQEQARTSPFWLELYRAQRELGSFMPLASPFVAVIGPLSQAMMVVRELRTGSTMNEAEVFVLTDRAVIVSEPTWHLVRSGRRLLELASRRSGQTASSPTPSVQPSIFLIDVPEEHPHWLFPLQNRLRTSGVSLFHYVVNGRPTSADLEAYRQGSTLPYALDIVARMEPEQVLDLVNQRHPVASVAGIRLSAELLVALRRQVKGSY